MNILVDFDQTQGLDVSKWDVTEIDFGEYAKALDFVSVKVSEGMVMDPLFPRQWAAAKGRTVRFPYHFWRAYADQKRSVQKMLEWLGGDAGEIEAALDLEVSDGATDVMVRAKIWTDEYHRLTGLWPIIYSSRGFLHSNGADYQTLWERLAGTYHNAWLANCKLWLAEWPFDDIQEMTGYAEKGNALRAVLIREVIEGRRKLIWPTPPAPFKKVDIWQWTSRFPPQYIPGYFMGANHKEAVDHNFFNLTRDAFRMQYPIIPLTEGENPMTTIIKPIGMNTRIRADHNTYSAVLTSCGPSDEVECDEIWTAPADGPEVKAGDQWGHAVKVSGLAVNGWIAIRHKGTPISTIVSSDPGSGGSSDIKEVDITIRDGSATYQANAVKLTKI